MAKCHPFVPPSVILQKIMHQMPFNETAGFADKFSDVMRYIGSWNGEITRIRITPQTESVAVTSQA